MYHEKEQTLIDLHADAWRAFNLVVDIYAIPLDLKCPSDHVHKLFHFVEAKRWAYYLRYIAHFNVAQGGEAKVEGVTHSYATNPKMGINRNYHTFATLVHESIHFFSHYNFRKAFTISEYEGATEYLTRNLLNDFNPRKDVNGRGDIYARELAPFLSLIVDDECLRQLCKAYFSGDSTAISSIKR